MTLKTKQKILKAPPTKLNSKLIDHFLSEQGRHGILVKNLDKNLVRPGLYTEEAQIGLK